VAESSNKKSNTKTTKIKNSKSKTKKKSVNQTRPLNEREKIFCREYVKQGNGQQSAIKAGYAKASSRQTASRLLTRHNIQKEISRLSEKREKSSIMSAQEVMELYSAIARGEVKDQFGLDASLNDRIKAMNELAKRTVDIDNRVKGIPDSNNQVSINVHWRKS
jgi:phage terminase small subunit